MEGQMAQRATFDYATEVTSLLTRECWTAETLSNALRLDENNRVFNPAVALGALVEGLNPENERDRAPRVLSHLQRALTPQPSGRWMPLVTRRAAQIKRRAQESLDELFASLYADAENRPGLWLKTLVERVDTESKALEQQRGEAQAKLRQAEKELEPLQARINAFLQTNASRHTITRLVEVLTALLQVVDRGVGLTAVVLMAERLVNDREAHAFGLDMTNAALGILQELRGRAQAERDRIAQFAARCRAVAQQLASSQTKAQVRLAANPYADVDLTEVSLAERLQNRVQFSPSADHFARLVELDESQLYLESLKLAAAPVRQVTSGLALVELIELQAAEIQTENDALPIDGDLVAATLEAAYRRAGAESLELNRRATTQDWWLVGVADESNPDFAFENATLVGTGRRDQVQFLHVQVGAALQDLTAFVAAAESFDRALAVSRRNYYVLDALAMDDRARQVFALGLAGDVIAVQNGAFVVNGENGSAATLGSTAEEALEQFSQHAELIKETEERFNALPLAFAAERLEAYLARGRSVQDELWWEFASYVRERVELLRHQLTFAANQQSVGKSQ